MVVEVPATTNNPVVVWGPCTLDAWMVNGWAPAGVDAVLVMVRRFVHVPIPLTGLLVNEAAAPVGKTEVIEKVTLSFPAPVAVTA